MEYIHREFYYTYVNLYSIIFGSKDNLPERLSGDRGNYWIIA